MNKVYLCNCLLITNGVVVIVSPYCFNYAAFITFGVVFGFTAGLYDTYIFLTFISLQADCIALYGVTCSY